jgi:hypothetical protein
VAGGLAATIGGGKDVSPASGETSDGDEGCGDGLRCGLATGTDGGKTSSAAPAEAGGGDERRGDGLRGGVDCAEARANATAAAEASAVTSTPGTSILWRYANRSSPSSLEKKSAPSTPLNDPPGGTYRKLVANPVGRLLFHPTFLNSRQRVANVFSKFCGALMVGGGWMGNDECLKFQNLYAAISIIITSNLILIPLCTVYAPVSEARPACHNVCIQ